MAITYFVSASRVIGAPADQVYSVLSDYRRGHPHILPAPYFSGLVVEEGGRGAGTVIRFRMTVLGARRTFRAEVSEPRPGEVLVEADPESGVCTTFTVSGGPDESRARVTISTEVRARRGLPGLLDRWLTTWMLRRIYTRELGLLDVVARRHLGASSEALLASQS